jgi:hypothetical protein
MGGKTIGNDLDNAWITFDRCELTLRPECGLVDRSGFPSAWSSRSPTPCLSHSTPRNPFLCCRVKMPRSALLNRYVDVGLDGQYIQKVPGVANIDMIGQRLYTGRIVVAGAHASFARST